MVYKTEFINERATRVQVIDQEMRVVLELRAGDRRFIEGDNPENMFSRYSKVTYLPENKVEAEQNRDWKNPYGGGWSLEITNESGQDQKVRTGVDEYTFVPAGLGRAVRMRVLGVPLIRFERIILKTEKRRMPDRKNPFIFFAADVAIMEKIERPKGDLERIDAELKSRSGLK